MVFTSWEYLVFILSALVIYWMLARKNYQNALLLVGSYIFYGYIHPWFCLLIATSTIVDYFCGLAMERFTSKKLFFLIASLICNLGLLGFFKYFNFFTENFINAANGFGVHLNPSTLKIFLPVGISFYTFQTLSYTIDIYRGQLRPRKNFIDFALFVAFFPQLVSGPIERASRMLPQIEKARRFDWALISTAFPLFIKGYLKKLVIADNVAVYADKVFMLEHPTMLLLIAGAAAFAVQIYADFSAYTDIARASARLFGFELIENFNSPYLAVSPSDFWRRWHISFSTWIRDYLYIPLGGSKVSSKLKFVLVLLISMGLCGLWHGAAWNFVFWGIYHAVLLFVYHMIGLKGDWKPRGISRTLFSWLIMICLTLIGWMIFRAPNIAWLLNAIVSGFSNFGLTGDSLIASLVIFTFVLLYIIPFFVFLWIDRLGEQYKIVGDLAIIGSFIITIIFHRDGVQDFIYFQF